MRKGFSSWLTLLPLLVGCHSLRPAQVVVNVPTEPAAVVPAGGAYLLPPVASAEVRVIPVSLDSVLRLASDRNNQIQIARAKVEEAYADEALARKAWLPRVHVGASYYRHEGGIQDFQGNLLHSSYGAALAGMDVQARLDPREAVFQRVEAERKLWQQKRELSKLTSENLLDAAGTYVDLLAARAAEALAEQADRQLAELEEQTRGLTKVDKGAAVELARVEAELRAHRLQARKLREGGNAAAAKLAYLLGLDPAGELVPVEPFIVPLYLVDVTQPVDALVSQALSSGPGVREMEGLLRLIDDARAKAEGPGRWAPAVELCATEGAFGAGPGGSMAWANRFDAAVRLRWDVTEVLTAGERRRQADAKVLQARLGQQDLRERLTLGVREAREAILSGLDQVRLAEEQVRHAEDAYALSRSRFQENIKGRSPSEVLLAVRSLGGARLQYVQTVRDLDKAQLRLFMLTGAARD